MIFVGIVAVCVGSWVAAPLVALRRHGSLDGQRLSAICEETRLLTASRDAAVTPVPALPRPRRAADRDAPSGTTIA